MNNQLLKIFTDQTSLLQRLETSLLKHRELIVLSSKYFGGSKKKKKEYC